MGWAATWLHTNHRHIFVKSGLVRSFITIIQKMQRSSRAQREKREGWSWLWGLPMGYLVNSKLRIASSQQHIKNKSTFLVCVYKALVQFCSYVYIPWENLWFLGHFSNNINDNTKYSFTWSYLWVFLCTLNNFSWSIHDSGLVSAEPLIFQCLIRVWTLNEGWKGLWGVQKFIDVSYTHSSHKQITGKDGYF